MADNLLETEIENRCLICRHEWPAHVIGIGCAEILIAQGDGIKICDCQEGVEVSE